MTTATDTSTVKAKRPDRKVRRVRTADTAYASRYFDVCPLCRLDHTDPILVALLEARQAPTAADRDRAISAVLEKHADSLEGVTLKQEWRHNREHRSPQPTVHPASRSKLIRENVEEVAQLLQRSPRRLAMLKYIGRARKVDIDQIVELFWADIANTPAARKLAQRDLRTFFEPRHLVCQVPITGTHFGESRQVYGLGVLGAAVLQRLCDRPWDWISGPGDIGYKTLLHDKEVTDLFNALYLNAKPFRIGPGEVRPTISMSNFYAAHDLFLGLNGQERWFTGKTTKRTISPDGFWAIGIDLPAPLDGVPESTLHPLLVEYDTGAKRDLGEAADQLLSHVLLAQSRSLLQRFPQLEQAPDGYAVPLQFVFAHTKQRKDLANNRMRKIMTLTRERFVERGYQLKMPIWAVHHQDWLDKQLHAPSYSLWADNDQFEREDNPTVFSRLMTSNKALHQPLDLDSQATLIYNPSGGAWKSVEKKRAEQQADAANSVLAAISAHQTGSERAGGQGNE